MFTSFEHEDEEETALDLPVVEEESRNSPDSENDSGNQDEITFQYKEDVVNFWKSGKRKKLSFNTVKARYKMVKSFQQLYSWEKWITKGGTRIGKLKEITEKTLEKFTEAWNRKTIIHDTDLRRWALQENQNLNLEGFRALSNWLQKFKNKHRIVMRKTTVATTTGI